MSMWMSDAMLGGGGGVCSPIFYLPSYVKVSLGSYKLSRNEHEGLILGLREEERKRLL